MRDLIDAPTNQIAIERARIATEGWGAQLLALQDADGRWGNAAWNRGFNSTMHVLMLLREMGLDPASDEARRAVGLVRDHVTWKGSGPQECDDNRFFEGEVEPCINGQVALVGAYFEQNVRGIINRLLSERFYRRQAIPKKLTMSIINFLDRIETFCRCLFPLPTQQRIKFHRPLAIEGIPNCC